MSKISSGAEALSKKSNAGTIPRDRRWVFGFKYWRQMEHFGVDQEKPKWFVSLLERLQAMGKITVAEVRERPPENNYRFHTIDWKATNCPIARKDLAIPSPYDDEKSYPVSQFQVSIGKGRVVGFFDEVGVFQIVLLDPLHNLQPSGLFDYRVRDTKVAVSELAAVQACLDQGRNAGCAPDCKSREAIERALSGEISGKLVHLAVQPSDLMSVDGLIARGRVQNYHEVFDHGHATLLDQEDPANGDGNPEEE